MRLTIRTEVEILPSKPITPWEIQGLTTGLVGKIVALEIEGSKTVQQLADAADIALNLRPEVTIQEKVFLAGAQLDNNATLDASGVRDGDELIYRFKIPY
jgi:hypothetical protein